MTPKWLNETKISACNCCELSVSGKKSYLDKTLSGIRQFFAETFLQELNAKKDGLLQKLDPRLKLTAALISIFALSFIHRPAAIILTYVALLLLAFFSKLGVWSFTRRMLLTTGLFTALIILPTVFNISIPGRAILVIYKLKDFHVFGINLPSTLTITDNGLRFFFLFWLRVLTMASVSVLAIATTKREHLLSALQALRLPSFLTMMAALAYRFLHILIKVVENIHLAKKSRSIKLDNNKEERRWVAGRIGWTFEKSIALSEEITQAMVSRGWQGDNSKANIFKFKANDYIALIFLVPFFALLFFIIIKGY